jgi:hypothetical protein
VDGGGHVKDTFRQCHPTAGLFVDNLVKKLEQKVVGKTRFQNLKL